MTRRRHASLVVLLSIAAPAALAALAALATGCADNPVGRKCDLGTATPGVNDVVVASPSLDCVSRTCLKVPQGRDLPPGSDPLPGNTGLCTAECTSDDECNRVPESPCVTGFTCGIPDGVTVGDFCCRKLCICKDYIVIPDSGHLGVPQGCDAKNAENTCCNLAGRRGNPLYASCKN
jgi:hypothetical protein